MTSPETLAGYRLIRKLGSGSRADVFLGAATTDDSASPRTAALKMYRPEVARGDIGRELAVLGMLQSSHCVRLVDVATSANGAPIPILGRVPRGSLAQLLLDRESIEVGEAVTALAPLPSTLRALHALGMAHSKLSAAAVHFGFAGEPVLLGFGHAQTFEEGLSMAALDEQPAVAVDATQLATLVRSTLARTRRDVAAERVSDLAAWLESPSLRGRFEFFGELEERLFDLAEAQPLEFSRVASPRASVPARIGEPTAGSLAADDVTDEASGAPATTAGSRTVWLSDAILLSPFATLRVRLGGLVAGVRKPFWILAGAIVAALVLAVVLLPGGQKPSAAPGQRSSPVPTRSAAPLPDDPLSALPLLIASRNRCIRDASVLCLDASDEPSSAALSADTAMIRRIQAGEEIPASAIVVAHEPTLTERLGDSALVDLGPDSTPASALMVRGEAGWRIRSFPDETPLRP